MQEPPELSESGRHISPALDHIVKHCLEKDPARRFQSARDIAFALSESTVTSASGSSPSAAASERRIVATIAGIALLLGIAAMLVFFKRLPA